MKTVHVHNWRDADAVTHAEMVRNHLRKNPMSVADVSCVADEMEQMKAVFTKVLGDLVERVTFISR